MDEHAEKPHGSGPARRRSAAGDPVAKMEDGRTGRSAAPLGWVDSGGRTAGGHGGAVGAADRDVSGSEARPAAGAAGARAAGRTGWRASRLRGLEQALPLLRQPPAKRSRDRTAQPGARGADLQLAQPAGGALRGRALSPVARQPRTAGDRARGGHPLAVGEPGAAMDVPPEGGFPAPARGYGDGDLAGPPKARGSQEARRSRSSSAQAKRTRPGTDA